MLKFRNIESLSTVDFPPYITSTIFTVGCNLRCPFCYNQSLFESKEEDMNIDEALKKLKRSDNFNIVEAVAITGGEPMMHPEIVGFVRALKEMGYRVKIDTNGSHPRTLEKLLKIADYIAMDIKTQYSDYHKVGFMEYFDIIDSIDILKHQEKVPYEFRITMCDELIDSYKAHRIAKVIAGGQKLYLQKLLPENTYSKATPIPTETFKYYQDLFNKYIPTELRL